MPSRLDNEVNLRGLCRQCPIFFFDFDNKLFFPLLSTEGIIFARAIRILFLKDDRNRAHPFQRLKKTQFGDTKFNLSEAKQCLEI